MAKRQAVAHEMKRFHLPTIPEFLVESTLAIAAGLVSLLLAIYMLGVNRSVIGQPWADGDQLGAYSIAKAITQHGWYSPNPTLGAPYFQDFYLYPMGDLRTFLEFRLLAELFTANPFEIVNLYSLAGFVTIGFFAYFTFRTLNVSRWLAVPLAISLSIAPWHFSRMVGHVFLADFSSLLVGLTAIFLLRKSLVTRTRVRLSRPQVIANSLGIVFASVYVAWSGIYFTAIVLILAVTVLLGPAIMARRSTATLAAIAFVSLTVVATAGWIGYQRQHVETDTHLAYARHLDESSIYGGSFSTLLLPSSLSGIQPLARLKMDFDAQAGLSPEGWGQVSIVGAFSILFTLTLILLALRQRRLSADNSSTAMRASRLLRAIHDECTSHGLLTAFLICLLLFISAGLGMLFAFLVTPDIRAWGRYSIVITIISLGVLGIAGTKIFSVSNRILSVPLFVGILVVVMIPDQVLGSYRLQNGSLNATVGEANYIDRAIEMTTNKTCSVFDLPVVPFPENPPVNQMKDLDQLWPYLVSKRLRFSYGVMKDTPQSDFQKQFEVIANEHQIKTLRQAGFCGALIDTYGYLDAGKTQLRSLEDLTGTNAISSPLGRYKYVSFGLTQ